MSIDRRKNFAKCLYNISSAFTTWHYFLTDLVYVEADGTEIECYMNIDVKQNDSGHWFYSFAIEKGSRPADVLSVVTDKSATTSAISITKNAEKINPSDENSSKKSSDRRSSVDLYDDTEIKTDTAPTIAPETTVGELRQALANSSRRRVYSKAKIVSLVKMKSRFSPMG